jgi:uncharacterized protein YndB with AHSA1/START domain
VTEPRPSAAVVQRVLPAPPDVVYDEWLDPDAMTEWMCPRPSRATRIELDPTAGGRFRIHIDDEGFGLSLTGRYLELDRPHRLRFTWTSSTWSGDDPESVVTVTLEPHGDEETLMTTIHHELLPIDLVEGHRSGWARIAQQLEDSLGGRPG